ncbi:hypothetical protein LJ656_06560 [Paraburkholderia sp. MMS20-SJTR3]|uniref:DUF3311 domain-containing protein n=1 Tax=Paraburkholderia sejongensis TaxID=2886946 RepID=A0ABS8JQP7_9BURK|nr:hypothetical protein [Paraburkholderia sp. MMS20-SJTR3]MCC8392246.1 hypothetical protein [Paraburkholderia sp. MMS20-SJTR3]
MQGETLKNVRAAAFLRWSALCLLMLPVTGLLWASNASPPQSAAWLCFSFVVYLWPLAGILLVISAGFDSARRTPYPEKDAIWREAHGR